MANTSKGKGKEGKKKSNTQNILNDSSWFANSELTKLESVKEAILRLIFSTHPDEDEKSLRSFIADKFRKEDNLNKLQIKFLQLFFSEDITVDKKFILQLLSEDLFADFIHKKINELADAMKTRTIKRGIMDFEGGKSLSAFFPEASYPIPKKIKTTRQTKPSTKEEKKEK